MSERGNGIREDNPEWFRKEAVPPPGGNDEEWLLPSLVAFGAQFRGLPSDGSDGGDRWQARRSRRDETRWPRPRPRGHSQ